MGRDKTAAVFMNTPRVEAGLNGPRTELESSNSSKSRSSPLPAGTPTGRKHTPTEYAKGPTAGQCRAWFSQTRHAFEYSPAPRDCRPGGGEEHPPQLGVFRKGRLRSATMAFPLKSRAGAGIERVRISTATPPISRRRSEFCERSQSTASCGIARP